MKHVLLVCLTIVLFGCATAEETANLRRSITSIDREFYEFKDETNSKLSALAKDTDNLRKQVISQLSSTDNREDKIKTILGKLDELDHQLQVYWSETKAEMALLKRGTPQSQISQKGAQPNYEAAYKEAFEVFQKGLYEEAVQRFEGFLKTFPDTPLAPNAYYWMGDSYMNLKGYEKAIVSFQEVLDKFPKSEKAPRALLSQAEAFAALKDKKSSMTILKKVIELYPKTEEAAIAERKLRAWNL